MAYLVFLQCVVLLPIPFSPLRCPVCLVQVAADVEELFVLREGYRVLAVAQVPLWVVSLSTDQLSVQTDCCQVYFKPSQRSVLCQAAFRSDSSLRLSGLVVLQNPKMFSWLMLMSLVLTMEILVFKQ